MYKSRKSAQASAFFAREAGGQINIIKLVKLLYLADREFMNRYDCLIMDDQYVSMPHGPVASQTLNYINGGYPDMRDWAEFICDREDHFVANAGETPSDDDLDELSRAELKVLADVWSEHGAKTKWQLRDWTHKYCAEWKDPHGSSVPIRYEEILSALGKKDPDLLAQRLRDEMARTIDAC